MKIKNLKNYYLYSGVSKEEYHSLLPDILQENKNYLTRYSLIGMILFIVLTAASLFTNGFIVANIPGYFLSFLIMGGIYICTKVWLPDNPKWTMPLIYLFMAELYGFSIFISLIHAERPAVSLMVFLLATPLLFLGDAVQMTCFTVLVFAAFITLSWHFKAPDTAEVDTWNTLSYTLLALIISVLLRESKIKALSQARRINYLSLTDILTGVKNRNCYEDNLKQYPGMIRQTITCVYGDVNGLHELNNSKGHEAGDIMLQTVAHALRDCFGRENTYRIGGDEFVAFRLEDTLGRTERDLTAMEEYFGTLGYHVSFGTATHGSADLSMEALIKEAEAKMYQAKRAYYSQAGKDRRNR